MTDTNAQRFTLHNGDCLEVMRAMPENSIDSIVTDPPYGLAFMGKDWDHGVPGVPFWAEALRVAKPGAMLLAFGGTRTFHRLTCAIEDAGWEIRDCVMWLYGSGFPKSHNISKAIDKAAGAEREVVGEKVYADGKKRSAGRNETMHEGWQRPWRIEDAQRNERITAPATPESATWDGWGTTLKPAWEPIIVAMKPTDGTFAANALRHGVAGLWIDGARVGTDTVENGRGGRQSRETQTYGKYEGQSEKTFVSGRWPANVIHDGSDEVTAGFPVTSSRPGSTTSASRNSDFGMKKHKPPSEYANDTGSAARFFYCAKASRAERNAGLEGLPLRDSSVGDNRPSGSMSQRLHKDKGRPNTIGRNHHPTVKPLALMRYLCRLTKTPTGGVVLDPFMGSGTTGIAAILEGRDFIGIDNEAEYVEIARRRIEHHMPDELPLFKEAAD